MRNRTQPAGIRCCRQATGWLGISAAIILVQPLSLQAFVQQVSMAFDGTVAISKTIGGAGPIPITRVVNGHVGGYGWAGFHPLTGGNNYQLPILTAPILTPGPPVVGGSLVTGPLSVTYVPLFSTAVAARANGLASITAGINAAGTAAIANTVTPAIAVSTLLPYSALASSQASTDPFVFSPLAEATPAVLQVQIGSDNGGDTNIPDGIVASAGDPALGFVRVVFDLNATCNITNLSTLFDLQFICDSRSNGVQVVWSSPLPLAPPISSTDFYSPAAGQFLLNSDRTNFEVPFTIPAGTLGSDSMGSYGLVLNVSQSAEVESASIAPPSAMITPQPGSGNVLLTWPTNLTAVSLQQSPDLYNWTTTAEGNTNTVVLPANAGKMFFRLTQPLLNLALSQNATPNPVVAGSNLTCTITVTNSGPADASGVLVNLALPLTNAILQSVSAGGGTYTESPTNIVFSLGNLAAGSAATFAIGLAPLVEGDFLTTAAVSCNEINGDPFDSMIAGDVTVLSP